MPVHPFRGFVPRLGRGVFLAPSAVLTGQVEVGDGVSFWFHTVARGDVNHIRIGAGTNIQDGAVLHVSYEKFSLTIGQRVTVGHSAVVHGCTIEDEALIGIGARVLDGAVIERGAQVAAGAVVAPGKRIRAGWLAMGVPAREARELNGEQRAANAEGVERYRSLKEDYRKVLGSGF